MEENQDQAISSERFYLSVWLTPTWNNKVIFGASKNRCIHSYDEPHLTIGYQIYGFSDRFRPTKSKVLSIARKNILEYTDLDFITYNNQEFFIDIDVLRKRIKDEHLDWSGFDWLNGKVKANYEILYKEKESQLGSRFHSGWDVEIVLTIGVEEMENSKPKRIFLSHKSSNKPMVREYAKTLQQLGLSPWLDEDDLKAGDTLDRALNKGISDSVAAVFFITPQYEDKRYLASEIDYAIGKKQDSDDLTIITLSIADAEGNRGEIPDLLKRYVWKEINHDEHLKGLREILKALPFETKISP